MSFQNVTRRTFVAGAAMAATVTAWGKPTGAKPRVGCQLNGFNPKPDEFDKILQYVRQAKEWDYEGFETNIRFVSDQFANPKPARAKLDAIGSTFIGMHTSTGEAAKGDLAGWCDGGHALGAHYIVMSAKGLSPTGEFIKEELLAKCKMLEGFGRTINAHGMKLAYHNHQPEFANHNAENQGLADHTDPALVHFLMDAGHGYQGGGDPALFMRKNSHRLVGCHIKTFLHHDTQVPLGHGDFGFEDLAKAIHETGWAGWLECEEGGGKAGGDTAAIVPDREYIRRVFGV
ncbi:MAG: TIM barrel protein [Bryocella sp.]